MRAPSAEAAELARLGELPRGLERYPVVPVPER
jgi:hypothetical protein